MATNGQSYHQILAELNSISDALKIQLVPLVPADTYLPVMQQLDYIVWCITKSEEYLLTDTDLNVIRSHISTMQSYLNALSGNPTGYAVNIANSLRELLVLIQTPRNKQKTPQESRVLLEGLRSDIATLTAEIENRKAQFQVQGDELSQKLKAINKSAGEIDKQFAAISVENAALASRLEGTLESKISTALNAAETRLNISLDDFVKGSSEQKAQMETSIKSFEISAEARFGKIAADTKFALDQEKIAAQALLYSINNIYQIAGSNSTAGQTIKSANSERLSYWLSGLLALIILIGASYFAYNVIEPALVEEINLQTAVARIAIMFSLFLPAAFLAGLVSKHRRAEISFRSLAIRLAAFEPFLANLSEIQKAEMRVKMSDVFFSDQISDEKTKSTDFDISKMTEKQMTFMMAVLEKTKEFLPKG